MSVGISQVNFDAQVLEDEEEATLEKEDQEREREIRELLNSELDDGLLDDDNASFSSHDLRSSGYSRDTPFSDDFSEQASQTFFNGQDAKKIIPSERGAFDRPPLITQHAFTVINASGQNQDLDRINQPYRYHTRHQYEDHYGDPGYYDYKGQGSPYNGQVDGYEQSYDHHEGGANDYHSSPDDMDEGIDHYGNYSAPETMHGQHHYPPQSNLPASNFDEGNNRSGDHNFNEDYRGYDEGGSEGQNIYDHGAPSVNEQSYYRIDTPGNYRVQYHGQHESIPHVSDRGSERHTNEIANGFSEDGARDIVQLQILYKARGRKLDELTQMLKNQEEEMTKEIRILNHQNAMMKDERNGISGSLENSQKMVQACNTELNTLKGQLAAANQQINALKESKEEVVSKLHITETTIDSLNQQLVELSRSESLTRAKEQHESVVNAMRKKHEEQVLTLKQKLDEAVLSRDCKHEEANQLRDELVEKAEMINSLTRSLDSSQKQCQEILKSGTMSEINQLRLALQESSTARNVVEGQCISLKHELSELQEQVKMYESASRLGVGLGSSIHNDSLPHLTVRNLNKENWSTPKSHKAPLEETVSELKQELEQCLVSNKAKREQVHKLETELSTVKNQLKDQQIKAQRMERIAQEHEDKSQELEMKIQELEINKKDPDEEYKTTLKDLEVSRRNLQGTVANLDEAIKEREELSETCADLKQQMAQMVAEFDEDKRISIEKCREACLQLHEDAKNLLRDQLNQEHEKIVWNLKRDLEEHSEELIRIKECYVQLGEDSRGLEQKLREEFEKEKQMLLSENEAKLIDELQASLEKQYVDQLEKAQEQWKEDEIKRINDELLKQKDQLLKNIEEEKSKAVEEAVSKAREEWNTEHSRKDNQSDIEDQIAAAKREWIKNHNDELERRLSNAIQEVRRIWDEEQKLKTKEEIDKVRAELEIAHGESRDQRLNQAVELALSQAQADWLKNEEEIRQREIDQAVEVAITNAVAEAKVEWEKEIMAQDNLLQTSLAQERARWKKEEESVRSKAVEAAVAIAEVKWLEEEQKKISEAVEEAMQTARGTWQEEKKRDIAIAVDAARLEWTARKEDELNRVLESASSQLVEQFEEQKKEALEEAIDEARLQWEKRLSEEKGSEIASLREEIFREFEEQKKAEILETLEEAKEAWIEESEEQKREEVNEAMAYLESEYTKSLEEFKQKTLKEALEQARKQWTTEELSHREEIVKARLAAAREDWRRDMAQSTQAEIDRALSTAREAWAADHEKELEVRVSQLEKDLTDQLGAKYDEEKKQLVDDTLREAGAKFKNERRKLEEKLRRNNADDSSRARWQDERARLVEEHKNQLQHMRSEHDSKLADQRAQIERDLGIRMNAELEKARNGWEKEHQDARIQLLKQCEQKTRQAVENPRRQWEKQQRQEISRSCDDAVKRQQEVWATEREDNLSALEKVKHELAAVKKEYAITVDKLKRELIEEKKKTQNSFKRRDSRDYATQTALQVDSGSDTSFSSVDHVSASRGLHELRQHYLDTIAKIRDDVLDHVNQTKANAAKKIRGEVLKERHSTAKKLRKYYLQCLKQLLEEDRVAMEGNSSPASAEEKMNRMAEALRTVSPDRESHGQPSRQSEVDDGTQSPRSGVFHILRASNEPDVRDIESCARLHGRPRDGGPDGASDTAPIAGKEREFTPVLVKVTAMDSLECHSPRKHFTPERDFGVLPGQRTKDRAVKAYNMAGSVIKHADNSVQDTSVALSEKGRQRNYGMHERALKQKAMASYKRGAPSPAFSVKSYESDQYSELPTVIHVSGRELSGSKDSNSSIPSHTSEAKELTISPVTPSASDLRCRPSAQNRVTKLASRDKERSSSPSLPSKPRIDVRSKRAQNSS